MPAPMKAVEPPEEYEDEYEDEEQGDGKNN